MVDPLWWQEFFRGVAVDLWLALGPKFDTVAEVDFIERTLELPKRSRLLDVPCGGGRHSVELALRGHQVTGIDLSEEFLQAARILAEQRGAGVNWQQTDMRELPRPATFDGVLCLGNSFGYLDDAGNAAFLRAASAALKPGGWLLLDSGSLAESMLCNFQAEAQYQADDITLDLHNDYDLQASRLETTYRFTRDGHSEQRRSSHRVYTYRELAALLHAAGFDNLRAHRSVDGEPFEVGAPRLLLAARKRASR